jgi:hypothetical protein
MSKPGIIYRGIIENSQSMHDADNTKDPQLIILSLIDEETLIDDSDDETIIDLEMADNPIRRNITNPSEDKFSPIRAKDIEINIFSGNGIDISTFITGGDRRFRVTVDIGSLGQNVFTGYLSLSDLSQEFLPDPNLIKLVATDGLNSLKDIPLKKFDDTVPKNEQRLADFLIWALSKTGLSLPLYVINNLREESCKLSTSTQFNAPDNFSVSLAEGLFFYVGQVLQIFDTAGNNQTCTVTAVNNLIVAYEIVTDGTFTAEVVNATFVDKNWHIYDKVYMNSKSFETEINECEDCYSIISKILGESCFLTQRKGRWYIKNVDEYDTNPVYQAVYNTDGTYDHIEVADDVARQIKPDLLLSWMNDDAIVSVERAISFVKLTLKYENWKEIVCNIDFSRGEQLSITPTEERLRPECWTYKKAPLSPLVGSAPDEDAYIKRVLLDGYEKEKYLVLPVNTAHAHALFSEPFPVDAKDKISASVDFAWSANHSTGGGLTTKDIFYVWLLGDDGSHWTLDSDGNWIQSNVAWNSLINFIELEWAADDVDETQFRTVSVDSLPIPVSGKIYFSFPNSGPAGGTVDDVDTYYNNFNVTYKPFINGSYQKYSGQYHKVSQTINTKAKREVEIDMGDCPKRILKRAMLKKVGDDYVICGKFGPWNVNNSMPDDFMHPYGEIQVKAVWNQFNRVMVKFEGTLDGLLTNQTDSDGLPSLPDIIERYEITDVHSMTTNGGDELRYFQCLHFEQDLYNCEMGCFLHEVRNTKIPAVYSDPHEFKYITA